MKEFLVDLDRCVGCYACIISCKDENNLEAGVNRLSLQVIEGKEQLYKYFIPKFILIAGSISRCTTCPQLLKHEKQPACVANCLTDAIKYESSEKILKLTKDRHVKVVNGIPSITYVSSNQIPTPIIRELQ